MARPLRKAQDRLKRRQAAHQEAVKVAKDGGKSFKRPGSMNPHKSNPSGSTRKKR